LTSASLNGERLNKELLSLGWGFALNERWIGDSMTPTANQSAGMDARVAVNLGADYNIDATTLQPTNLTGLILTKFDDLPNRYSNVLPTSADRPVVAMVADPGIGGMRFGRVVVRHLDVHS